MTIRRDFESLTILPLSFNDFIRGLLFAITFELGRILMERIDSIYRVDSRGNNRLYVALEFRLI